MIIPGITPERIEGIFGAPTTSKRIMLNASAAYIDFLQKIRAEGMARVSLEQAVNSWEDVGIAPFVRGIQNPALRDQASRFTKPYPATGAFTEAVMNAIEHGSDFCRRGDVAIDLQTNDQGFLFSVTILEEEFKGNKFKDPKSVLMERGATVLFPQGSAIVTCEISGRI
jgi:hypothetical protein